MKTPEHRQMPAAFERPAHKEQQKSPETLREAIPAVKTAGDQLERARTLAAKLPKTDPKVIEMQRYARDLKRALLALGAAVVAQAGLAGYVTWSESQRRSRSESEEQTVEQVSDESSESSQNRLPPLHPESAQAVLARQLINELAVTLREREMGLGDAERLSSEETRILAEQAVQNLLDSAGAELRGLTHEQIEARLRADIESTCTAPSCDPVATLQLAGSLLASRRFSEGFADAESGYETMLAAESLSGGHTATRYAMLANRPDILGEDLRHRIATDTEGNPDYSGVYDALRHTGLDGIETSTLSAVYPSLDHDTQEAIRIALQERSREVNLENALLNARLEGAEQTEALLRAGLEGLDPFSAEAERIRVGVINPSPEEIAEMRRDHEAMTRETENIFAARSNLGLIEY